MKKCPPGVNTCGGDWIQKGILLGTLNGNNGIPLGYGLLYNWYAATDVRGIAPTGFRVPSGNDLQTLWNFSNSQSSVFNLKSTRVIDDGDPYWISPQSSTPNNEFNFTANPAGRRNSGGSYGNFRNEIALWCTTASAISGPVRLFRVGRFTESSDAPSTDENKKIGLSIRCVSDTAPETSLVQDASGNNYSWIQIGSQYWLQQSLKTTKYINGDDIETDLNNSQWLNTTDGAWAYPNGDSNLPI